LAGLLVLGSTASALAAGPYIGAAGGATFIHDGDISVEDFGTRSATVKYDTGAAFNVSAGYDFQPVRVEFQFGYKNANVDSISGPGGTFFLRDTDVRVLSYMANVFYDFKTASQVTPYIGVGMGLLTAQLNESGDSSEDVNEFGIQAMAGAAFKVTRNVALDISYQFQTAPSDFSKNGTSLEYKSSNVMGGLRFTF
jgi:outer membrane immunogenic protein